ncbi:MAG: VTT domain-containing protein [Archangium sp.]|nr:VTT domain-containing protein [Archangium sp.]MDP3153496.1 VTT domain-containing protein [Archangium sp.]MDP3574732.1 VTT domain-containing protein [Archangium sp.]
MKLALLVGAVGLALGLFVSGAFDDFSLERTAQLVRSYGPWGIAVYLLAFTFLQPLGMSGTVFAVVAGLVWPPWLALLLAMTGACGSATINVAFARYVAFDWVQARIPPKLRRYERWVTDRGLLGVILYRAATGTMPPAQLLIGVLNVPLPRLIIGTVIGFIPQIALNVFLGGGLTRWLAGLLGIS